MCSVASLGYNGFSDMMSPPSPIDSLKVGFTVYYTSFEQVQILKILNI